MTPKRIDSERPQQLVKRDKNCYKVVSGNEGDVHCDESENGVDSLSEEENGDTFREIEFNGQNGVFFLNAPSNPTPFRSEGEVQRRLYRE